MSTLAAVVPIREASRQLVREWGFLRPTLANTDLSPAAAHCLFEIGENDICTGPALREALRVGEAELARVIQDLAAAGEIEAQAPVVGPGVGAEDTPGEFFGVTAKGRETLRALNMFGTNQVQAALQACAPAAINTVLGGLQIYAAALQALRLQSSPPPSVPPSASGPSIRIVPGYQPGILGRTLEMHTQYYSSHFGWGRTFELTLAAELTDLLGRLDKPINAAWAAVRTVDPPKQAQASWSSPPPPPQDRIVGAIFVDGEELGSPGVVARLRAFIVDDEARGSGAGRRLFNAAMDFVKQSGFDEMQLWTMRPLVAARKLYEAAGFVALSEEEKFEFGVRSTVMHYRWRRSENP